MNISHVIALGFGFGRAPYAPGTFGSLPGVGIGWPLIFAGWQVFLIATIIVSAACYWATYAYLKDTAQKDPPEVVADEISGQLIALAPLSAGLGTTNIWLGVLVGFGFFRLFDILKPWPISALDRQPGAFGVMADDWAAGLAGALCLVFFGAAFDV